MNGNDENRYMTNSVNYTKPDYCKKKFNSPKNFRATDNFTSCEEAKLSDTFIQVQIIAPEQWAPRPIPCLALALKF